MQELIEKVEKVGVSDLQALVERLIASPLSLATVGPILHVARFDRVAEKFTVPSTKAA
jgi:predicted Zn-dependent peptidase